MVGMRFGTVKRFKKMLRTYGTKGVAEYATEVSFWSELDGVEFVFGVVL
ncbi:hypothetical protein A2U01_0110028, partial [Trifolium medium]|nr:hypothetical protein [Trifolium medium]